MRLGILGGTFNPIHLGHLRLAQELVPLLGLDTVLFVPAGQPPLRPEGHVASTLHRYTMVALATAGEPRFCLSDIECRRPGPSYSVETVEEVRAEVGSGAHLFFILGSDSFLMFPQWREPQRLLKQATLILVPRGDRRLNLDSEDVAPIHALLGSPRWIFLPRGSREATLEPGDVGVMPVTSLPISAREIRHRVRTGESIRGMVPAPVEEYIRKHRLYQDDPPSAV